MKHKRNTYLKHALYKCFYFLVVVFLKQRQIESKTLHKSYNNFSSPVILFKCSSSENNDNTVIESGGICVCPASWTRYEGIKLPFAFSCNATSSVWSFALTTIFFSLKKIGCYTKHTTYTGGFLSTPGTPIGLTSFCSLDSLKCACIGLSRHELPERKKKQNKNIQCIMKILLHKL